MSGAQSIGRAGGLGVSPIVIATTSRPARDGRSAPAHPDPSVQALFDSLEREGAALLAAGAHLVKGPEAEPDRSVWRILSCGGREANLTDEQIGAALPAFTVEEIAAARARVAPMIEPYDPAKPGPTSLAEILAEPSISRSEAIACGLMRERVAYSRRE